MKQAMATRSVAGTTFDPSRRALLAAAGAALAATVVPRGARAAGYPTRPVKIVVPWPPGSSTDIAARLLGVKLADAFGQAFIIDNRPGATGIIGAEAVAKSPPDGYTLLFNTASQASNKVVFPKLPFDALTDFLPVSLVYRNIVCLAVHPSVPARTLAEFVQYAKANPHKLSFGTPGVGTPHHLGGELLKQRAGFDMLHVPYKGGGPSVTDLVSGQIPASVASVSAVLQFARSNRVRILAIMDPVRYEEWPDYPAVAETYPNFDVSGWAGTWVPAGTPADVVARLNEEITRALKTSDVKRTMSADGIVPTLSSPERLAKLMRDDIERWTLVVRSGVKIN